MVGVGRVSSCALASLYKQCDAAASLLIKHVLHSLLCVGKRTLIVGEVGQIEPVRQAPPPIALQLALAVTWSETRLA
ncbi:hypothetical protein RT95_15950 [Xanthomonas campestris]|nr:hypothetical protein RT95_15950 [Xanthomonas campestris]